MSVVVPAYNEAEAIGGFLAELKSTLERRGGAYEILVVNDGSTDGTAGVLSGIPGVRTVAHERNRGYGEALKTGVQHAEHDDIVITDADGTYHPEDIPRLLDASDHADMIVGARVGKGANIPLLRRPAKWLLRTLANFLLETKIVDLNSGLRVFRRSDVLGLYPILPSGFSFTTTVTLAFLSRGRTVVYLPIGYHRRSGTSKIRPIRDTLNFFALITKTVLYFRPLRVFAPLALTFLFSGIGLVVYEGVVHHELSTLAVLLFLTGVHLAAIGAIADLIVNKP